MAGLIPEETLQTIRDRISLVDLVSNYVALKQNGRNHIGLCPFHNEKTPSFSVSDERGFFKCFGCGEGGNAFTFLMKIERLEFPEAVEELAKRAGVELPKRREGRGDGVRERLIELHENAAEFFRQEWASERGEQARRYLEKRGLSEETIEHYGIGLSPASGSGQTLTRWFGQQKVSRRAAVQSGLLAEREGRVYDRFRGRIMFPIRDRRGRVIAFGGRALGDDQPKYLNSPETPIFTKGDGVYGVSEARKAIRDANRVVLVEGYMDALMLVQAGIPYAVATLGTALTAQQLRLVRGVAGEQANVFFFFDGDRAGRQAASRAFGVCAEAGVWGRPAFLPDGMDPDDYVRAHGVEATLELLDRAPELLDFYVGELAPPGSALAERSRAAKDVQRQLGKISDPVQFNVLAQRAAQRLGVDAAVFSPGAAEHAPSQPPPAAQPRSRSDAVWPVAERILMESVAADGDVARWVVEHQLLDKLSHDALRDATARLCDGWEVGESIGVIVDELPEEIADHLRGALLAADEASEPPNRMQAARECAARIARKHKSERKRSLMQALAVAADEEQSNQIKRQINELVGEGERL